MKAFFIGMNIFFLSIVSFAQNRNTTKTNVSQNPSIDIVLSKIIKYSRDFRQVDDYGYAQMGSLKGYSSFNFPSLSKNNIQLSVSYQMKDYYDILSKVYVEKGVLKNIQFKNSKSPFNTKLITADWIVQNSTKRGYFNLSIPDYKKNEVLIIVYNKNPDWNFSDRIKFTDIHFQEIINDLTISGKPVDFIQKRNIQLAVDSINKIEEEKNKIKNIESKIREDSILNAPNFDNPIQIGNLLVSNSDYKKSLNSWQLEVFMNKYSNGWRLPSDDELLLIKKNIKNLDNYYYWGVKQDGSSQKVINTIDKTFRKFEDDDEFPLRLVKGYYDSSSLIYKLTANSIKLDGYLISPIDFPGDDIGKAIFYCKKVLGDGWMPPTFVELDKIWEYEKLFPYMSGYYKSLLGGYTNSKNEVDFIYSDDLNNKSGAYLICKNFDYENGKYYRDYLNGLGGTAYGSKIRLVKRDSFLAKVGKTIEIENLIIVDKLFPLKLNWYEARLAAKELGDGWRLPSIEELKVLYTHYLSNSQNEFIMKQGVWSATPYSINENRLTFTYPDFWYGILKENKFEKYINASNKEFYFIPVKSK